MNSRPWHDGARGRATPTQDEEVLETGEPIEGQDEAPAAKKIPGRQGRFSQPQGQGDHGYHTEPPAPGEGRMVLSSAKYLQKNTDPAVERENRKIRQKEKEQREGCQNDSVAFEKNVFNSGVLGGTLAMVGAVIWFVVGLANDIIFFYPPILFVIGLGAFFKGLMGGNSE
jgi:hypothetical protein